MSLLAVENLKVAFRKGDGRLVPVIDGVVAPADPPNGEVIITFHKGK